MEHEFNSRPDHRLDLFTVIPLAALVLSQLACLLQVEILNVLSLFEWFVSLALKRHQWGGTIKYTLHFSEIQLVAYYQCYVVIG